MMVVKPISPPPSLLPPQGPVKLAEGMVHQQDVGVPLEAATVTNPWPAPEPVPPPPTALNVSPASSRSSPPLIQPSGEVLCPFHATPLSGGLSKNGTPYMCCRDFDDVCPFWVMGADRVQTWTDAIEAKLHLDIRRGPWNCFHNEKTRLSRTVNPESPNKGRFFLACRQEESCKFFQWVDSEWSDSILKRRLSGYDYLRAKETEREEQEKFQRGQDKIKRTWWWCKRLEKTQPITPDLLKACFVELKSHLTL